MARVSTIGHGTRTIEQLAELALAGGVDAIVDVRRFPQSRRHPHFSKEALDVALPGLGISYEWRGEELGGRRHQAKDAPTRHPAWRNDAFATYADYMDTPSFREALERL